MSTVNGQPANASTFNTAYVSKITDSVQQAKYDQTNTDPASGGSIVNTQRELNKLNSFLGSTPNTAKDATPTWTNNDIGLSNDSVKQRADLLTRTMNPNSGIGHKHTGVAGDGPTIDAAAISIVPLQGFVIQGVDLSGVTGTTLNVATELTGKSASTNSTMLGVVVNNPENKIILRKATGSDAGDKFFDSSGNEVYARLSSGPFTLSFYVLLALVETSYNFVSSSDISWFYQELFNPLGGSAPVYSEFANIPSENTVADVPTASQTIAGKALAGNAAGTDVASAGAIGTVDGRFSNADHGHQGLHSIKKSGDTALYGDATLSGVGGSTLTQVGQNIEVSSPALSSTTPTNVTAAASAIGSGTTSAKSDHSHQGVYSLKKQGDTALFGAVELLAGTGMTLSQTGQVITFSATGGGGGGGSAVWNPTPGAGPLEDTEFGEKVWKFDNASIGLQKLNLTLVVPASYVAGTIVRMAYGTYSENNGAQQYKLQFTINRIRLAAGDGLNSVAHQRVTNYEQLMTGNVYGYVQSEVQLTDGSGQINSLNLAAGDILKVEMMRIAASANEDTADTRFIPSTTAVRFA